MTPAQVRRIRLRLGLSQAQLAERLGVHRITVAKWEGGARRVQPMVERLIRLVAGLATGHNTRPEPPATKARPRTRRTVKPRGRR